MSRFYSRALRVLDRVLRLDGSQVLIDEIDLAGAIQPVYDVRREAELGAAAFDERAGGYFQIGQDNVHGGAGTIDVDLDVYGTMRARFGPDAALTHWAWLCHAGVTQNAGGALMTFASLCLEIASLGAALAVREILIAVWNAEVTIASVSAFSIAGLRSTNSLLSVPGGETFVSKLPILIPAESTLGWLSVATGAGTIRLQTVCWAGPIGVYPPGMA